MDITEAEIKLEAGVVVITLRGQGQEGGCVLKMDLENAERLALQLVGILHESP